MKRPNLNFFLLTLIALSGMPTLPAAPLSTSTVPENVDWLLHVDADRFRETRIGVALLSEIGQLDLTQGQAKDLPIDPILILNGIRGLTLFGSMPDLEGGGEDFDGVLVLNGKTELIQIVQGLVSGMELESPESITIIEEEPSRILSLNNGEIFGAFVDDQRIAIGKSLENLNQFLSTNRGESKTMDVQAEFPSYRLNEAGFFFGAFVEGLGDFEELPVQARILQLTQSVSIQLGEVLEEVELLATLQTDSPTTGKQVYNVLQGILAMLVLTQNGQPDIAALAQSSQVSLDDRAVTLKLGYPVVLAEGWAAVLAEKIAAQMEASAESAEGESGDSGKISEEVPAGEGEPVS